MKTREVVFEEKSAWQRNDCINRGAEYDCQNQSTLQAVFTIRNCTRRIRCCTNEKCRERAAEMACL